MSFFDDAVSNLEAAGASIGASLGFGGVATPPLVAGGAGPVGPTGPSPSGGVSSWFSGLVGGIESAIGVSLKSGETQILTKVQASPLGQQVTSTYLQGLLQNPVYVGIGAVVLFLLIRGLKK